MKKLIWVVVVLIIIGGGWWVSRQSNIPASGGEPIRIGFIGPLTGPLADMGEEQKNTIEIAVEEINNNGGVNGRDLEFVYEDGKCDGKEAATAAQKLINIEKIKIVMPVCSSESLAVAPIAETNKVLEFAVWPTTPAFSGVGTYAFRNSYSDDDTSKLLAQVAQSKYKTIGVITETTDYTTGVLKAFKKYFTSAIFEEGFPPDSVDVRTQVAKILSHKPEAVLVNPNSPISGLAILQQLAQQKFTGQLLGNFFGTSNDVIQSSYAQGMIFASDPEVADSSLKVKLFETYRGLHGVKPNLEFAVAAQYDAIYILKQAIEAVGDDPTALKDYLHNLKDFEGLLGTYGFNNNGDMVGTKPGLKQIVNNQLVGL
ncbi:MAG: ABC transporter substrate-binding protein [Patescibacteria group bacterium]